MKTCKRGHPNEKGECRECRLQRQRDWNRAHKEQNSARGLRWYAANRERADEKARAWRKANADKVRAYGRRWIAARPELALDKSRKQRARRAGIVVRDAHLIEPMVSAWVEGCVYCGTGWLAARRTIDHVVAIVNGGTHTPDNIVPCCTSCNSSKSARDLMPWLKRTHGRAGLIRYREWAARRDQWLTVARAA